MSEPTSDFITAFRAYLLADAALAALLPNGAIYSTPAPENRRAPYVRMAWISGIPSSNIELVDDLTESVFQLDVYALDYGAAAEIKRTIIRRLRGVCHTLWSGWEIAYVVLTDQGQTTEAGDAGSADSWTRFRLDYRILHQSE